MLRNLLLSSNKNFTSDFINFLGVQIMSAELVLCPELNPIHKPDESSPVTANFIQFRISCEILEMENYFFLKIVLLMLIGN